MKKMLAIMLMLVDMMLSDFNPLLLWEPYHTSINKLIGLAPGLMFGIALLALMALAVLSGCVESTNRTVH